MPILLKKIITYSAFLITLVLFGLLFYSNSFNSPFERDEGEYAYSAWLMKNDAMPYENSFLLKPPMIVYIYFLASFINSTAVWPPRVIAFVFTLLTALLLGLIAKKEFGRIAGLLVPFLFIPMNTFPYLAPFAANTERFMQLPFVGVLAIYVFCKNKTGAWPFLWAGFLGAVALLTKQFCLLPLSFIFTFWIAEKSNLIPIFKKWRDIIFSKTLRLLMLPGNCLAKEISDTQPIQEKIMSALKFSSWIFGGILTGFLLVCGYFLVKVPPTYLWENWVTFPRYYATLFDIENFSRYFSLFLANWWILLFFILWFILIKIVHWKFYIILLILSLFSIIGSSLGHYYLLLIPIWSLISIAAIVNIGTTFYQTFNLKKNNFAPAYQLPSFLIIFIFTLITIIYPNIEQFKRTPKQMEVWIYGFGNPFIDAEDIAEKIATITKPEEKIFIAGSEPEILFYAKRMNSSRFDITYPLIMNTPFRETYQKEVIAELKKNPPAAIVFSNQAESGLWQDDAPKIFINYLKNLLREKYTLVGGFVQRNVAENQNGFWQDHVLENEASLLLYKKN